MTQPEITLDSGIALGFGDNYGVIQDRGLSLGVS